jgi:hypothetical protein
MNESSAWAPRSFVVKTSDDAGSKVFVNVCGSAKIPAPGGWTSGQARATRW